MKKLLTTILLIIGFLPSVTYAQLQVVSGGTGLKSAKSGFILFGNGANPFATSTIFSFSTSTNTLNLGTVGLNGGLTLHGTQTITDDSGLLTAFSVTSGAKYAALGDNGSSNSAGIFQDGTFTVTLANGTVPITVAGNVASILPYASTTGLTSTDGSAFATVGGNVGVGTSTPSYKLSVTGKAFITGTTTSNVFEASSTTATSTARNGWNLTGGCFSVNNACVGSGSLSGSGANTQIAYYTGANTLTSNSGFTFDSAASGLLTLTDHRVSISNTSVAGTALSVTDSSDSPFGTAGTFTSGAYVANLGDQANTRAARFTDGSRTATFANGTLAGLFAGAVTTAGGNFTANSPTLIVTSTNVGVGSTSPFYLLSVKGMAASNANGALSNLVISDSSNNIQFQQNGNGNITINQAAITGNPRTLLTLNGGASTQVPASTEMPDVNFALTPTITFNSGALTTQRQYLFQPRTYAFNAASTITNLSSVDISGAPQSGTLASTTNVHALNIEAASVQGAGANSNNVINSYGLTVNAQTNAVKNFAAQFLGGNVGIGTSTAQWLLQLAGTLPSFALSDTSATTNQKHWIFSSMGGFLYIGTSTDAFGTSTPAAITVTNTGSVGIGTSTPTQKFSVQGQSFVSGTSTMTNAVIVGSPGTATTSIITLGDVAQKKPGCMNWVWQNGSTFSTSSLYINSSGVLTTEPNACR